MSVTWHGPRPSSSALVEKHNRTLFGSPERPPTGQRPRAGGSENALVCAVALLGLAMLAVLLFVCVDALARAAF